MHPLVVFKRIHVRHEVSANSIGVNDFLDSDVLIEISFMIGRNVLSPANWVIGNAQVVENIDVEIFFTENE